MKSNRTAYRRVPVVVSLYMQPFGNCGSKLLYGDDEDIIIITDMMTTAMTTNLITRKLMMTIAGMIALMTVIAMLPMTIKVMMTMMTILMMTMMTEIAQLGEMSIWVKFFHTLPPLPRFYTRGRYFLRAG